MDFYKGHLGALVDRVTESDFSFVMYYAPWDADSQALKEEFESVARFYHSQVIVIHYFSLEDEIDSFLAY